MSQKIYSDLVVKGNITLNTTNAGVDTDKFLVQDSGGVIRIRTASEMLSDLGVTSSFVPYTGATAHVNLGEFGVSAGYFQADLTPTQPASVGRLMWNDTDGTFEFLMKGGNVTQQIGQELPILVKHADNTGLVNGTVVYTVGSDGVNNTVREALGDSDLTSATTFGIMTEDATGGNKAFCTTFGVVRNINTLALAEGQAIWLSPITPGAITSSKPSSPNHAVYLGVCIRSHATLGSIFVNISNGYELEELHNVSITSILNNEGLFYDSVTGLWKNKSIETVLGGTPVLTTQLSSILRQEFIYTGGVQQFTLSNSFASVLSVEVQGQGALHSSQYTITSPNLVTILDTLDVNDYIVVIYQTANLTGIPYYTQAQTDALLTTISELVIVNLTVSQSIVTNKMYRAFAYSEDITLTLIDPSSEQTVTIKKLDTTNNSIFVTSPNLIDGDPIAELSMYGESITLKWTGSTYDII